MMSNKKNNVYKINLQEVELKSGVVADRSLEFEFDNHDDLFNIIELVAGRNLFSDKSQSIEFTLGLKLLGEVILKNKDNALFEEFGPSFREFMKKLKSS